MDFDFRDLIDNMYDGLYFVDKERRITFWNKAAERITGFTAAEVKGSSCSDNILIHIDDKGNYLCKGSCPLQETIRDGSSREAEVYLHHKEGHRVPVSVRTTPLRGPDGAIVGGAELFTDVSSQEAMSLRIEELEKLAFIDNLTRLANRHYIELELQGRFAEMKRYGLSFGILLLDIDHFKAVNDTYGHDVGDLVLKVVAKSLLSAVRPFDLFGRWGGEEFIGIIRNVDASALAVVGNRARILVQETVVETSGTVLKVTVSVGATLAATDDNLESLLKRADGLLYKSKEDGRNLLTTDTEITEKKWP